MEWLDTYLKRKHQDEDGNAVQTAVFSYRETFKPLSFQYRIGSSTVAQIIIETCDVIYAVLKPDFMTTPQLRQNGVLWLRGFMKTGNFPIAWCH
ncbi:hypothetical protein LDENG_00231210 [Lucifuga dentata]|nr:hypothetical protein LDENG_00231210 [Lucifuga dentata]